MRFAALAAGAVMTAGLVTPVYAAEINDEGAKALQDSLTHYLPEAIAKSGLLTVTPASNRYEIVYDFSKLLDAANPSDFSITGLKPFSMFASPEDKFWRIESNGNLNVQARYKVADVLSDITYSIASYTYGGLFDADISLFRSADVQAKDVKFTSHAGTDQVEAVFGDMSNTMTATDAANGTVDLVSNGKFLNFAEKIITPSAPPVDITADSIDFDVTMKAVMVREVREIVVFALEHFKQDTLSVDEGNQLKAMIRKALPLASSIDETVTLSNLMVASPLGPIGVDSIKYGLATTGLTEATNVQLSVSAANPKIPEGVLPAMYASLVPDSAEISFGFPAMNVSGVINGFLDRVDFNKTGSLTPEDEAALGKIFYPDGSVTINLNRMAAKSSFYDVEMSGVMKGYPNDQTKVSFQSTIFARDYDKTVAYFQEAAKTEPQFSQVSFGLMMIKGFAKTDADGRQRWDVSVAEDGSVTVNGQVVKGPN